MTKKEQAELTEQVKGIELATKKFSAFLDTIPKTIVAIKNDILISKNDISRLSDRMHEIEQNEEITSEQCDTIKDAVRSRIGDILGNDALVKAKYYKLFSSRLYSDARKYTGLGSRIARTKRRDFQRVLVYIESWNPEGGSVNLKAYGDKLAKARVKARKMGY